MAKAAGSRTRKVGITHHPLGEEKKGQKRLQSKKQEREPAKQKRTPGGMATRPLSEKEKREIDRKGAKGGKTGGSRAGLVSSRKGRSRS
jgi:hypothetical protein